MKVQRTILLILLMISMAAHVIFGLEAQTQIASLRYQNNRQQAKIADKDVQIEVLEIVTDNQHQLLNEQKATSQKKYLGEFEITYYTAGPESTGKYPGNPAYGITRSGTKVEEGRTIAADWSILEPGTKVYIDGIGERIVEDTGSLIKGNSIDVYVKDVETAIQGGRHMAKVYVVKSDKNQ